MDIKNSDQHDGGGSCCMCDLCQEVHKRYLGFDIDLWNEMKETDNEES